jgi:hypothetical protein
MYVPCPPFEVACASIEVDDSRWRFLFSININGKGFTDLLHGWLKHLGFITVDGAQQPFYC